MSSRDKSKLIKAHMQKINKEIEDTNAVDTERHFDFWLSRIAQADNSNDLKLADEGYRNLVYLALKNKKYEKADQFMNDYKSRFNEVDTDWQYRYSIQLYSNSPRYFLDNPDKLISFLYPLTKSNDDNEKEKASHILLSYISIFENIFIVKDKMNEDTSIFNKFINSILPLSSDISDRLKDRLLLFLKLVNHDINFEEYHEIIDQNMQQLDDVLSKSINDENLKILVIGEPQIRIDDIYQIAKLYGFNMKNLDLYTEYDKIKNLDITRFKNTNKYCGIIVGPIPHNVKGMNYDSFLAKTLSEAENEYPYWKKCITEAGEFKITRNSFDNALRDIKLNLEGSLV